MPTPPLPDTGLVSRRPVRRRGTDAPLPRRAGFAGDNQRRLAIMAGLSCPRCGRRLYYDGSMLLCLNYGDRTRSEPACLLGWGSAECAEDEVYCGLS